MCNFVYTSLITEPDHFCQALSESVVAPSQFHTWQIWQWPERKGRYFIQGKNTHSPCHNDDSSIRRAFTVISHHDMWQSVYVAEVCRLPSTLFIANLTTGMATQSIFTYIRIYTQQAGMFWWLHKVAICTLLIRKCQIYACLYSSTLVTLIYLYIYRHKGTLFAFY